MAELKNKALPEYVARSVQIDTEEVAKKILPLFEKGKPRILTVLIQ